MEQAAYGRLYGSDPGAIHTYTHRGALRPTPCNSRHRRQKQTLPPRARNQAGRPDSARSRSTHLLQCIMKPLTEKWNRGNHGVRLVEHDRDPNSFQPQVRGRHCSHQRLTWEHTTTVLDNHITATEAPGLQRHSTKTIIISNTTSMRGRGNTVAVQVNEHWDPTA